MKKVYCVLFVLLALFSSCKSTSGNQKKALMVIHMQVKFLGDGAERPVVNSAEDLISDVNVIIEDFYAAGYKIIYHKITNRDGISAPEIHPDLKIVPKENPVIFTTNSSNKFVNKDFEAYLQKNKIDELYFVGLAGEECVYITADEALYNNYKVNIIENGLGTFNYKALEMMIGTLKNKGANVLTH